MQLELKLEHQEEHATFLDLDVSFLTEGAGFFSLLHVCTYLSSSIPSSIFFGSMFSENLGQKWVSCDKKLPN